MSSSLNEENTTTFSPAEVVQTPRVLTEKEGELPAVPPPVLYTTPHDIVLSVLHGYNLKSGSNDISSGPTFEKEHQDATLQAQVQSSSRAPDVLLDPFDGSALGMLLPQGQGSDSQNPSQVNLANNPLDNANPAGSEAVWSQLSRVLDIQGEISKMHLDLEPIGLSRTGTGSANSKGNKSPWKRHHKTPSENLGTSGHLGREDMSGANWPRQRALSTVSTISSSDEPGDDAGVNFQEDDDEKSRIRGEEFAKLSSQFEGRKEAIHDIMAKLNDLSKALGEFHGLPNPNIEFPASRNNTSGIAPLPSDPELKLGSSSARNSHLSDGSVNQNVQTTSHNTAGFSLEMPPLQRAKSETAANSISSSSLQRRKSPPTLLVNSLDLGKQPTVIDSPTSIVGFRPV